MLAILLATVQISQSGLIIEGCKLTDSKNKCISCDTNYILLADQGLCVTAGSIIKTTTVTATTPTVYSSSMSSQSQGSSVTVGLSTDINCKKTGGNGECKECIYRYYFDKTLKKCNVVNVFCKEWDDEGKCTACY